jgi:pimeloyl-ACP methyl ester carboxylesterase
VQQFFEGPLLTELIRRRGSVRGASRSVTLLPRRGAGRREFTVAVEDEPGAGAPRTCPRLSARRTTRAASAALIAAIGPGPARVAGVFWGGTVAQELLAGVPRPDGESGEPLDWHSSLEHRRAPCHQHCRSPARQCPFARQAGLFSSGPPAAASRPEQARAVPALGRSRRDGSERDRGAVSSPVRTPGGTALLLARGRSVSEPRSRELVCESRGTFVVRPIDGGRRAYT